MKINKKILIVEDDSALLDLLAEKFAGEGFDVLKAQHGAIGLEIAPILLKTSYHGQN